MSDAMNWSASFASASTGALSFYDDVMVPRMFGPWAAVLLDEAGSLEGRALLDVACGPGTVTRLAASRVGPLGRVTGCDLSPAMLDLARMKTPVDSGVPITYLECSADALSSPDATFDVVTCQQGLQFFPDRHAALTEMRRVLRPEGRIAIAVWCDIEHCPPFAAIAEALERVLGVAPATAFRNGPWGFGDARELVQLVEDSGFADVDLRRRELPVTFEGGPGQLLSTLHSTSVAASLARLDATDLAALATAAREATRSLTVDGVVRSHMTSNIVTATVRARRA